MKHHAAYPRAPPLPFAFRDMLTMPNASELLVALAYEHGRLNQALASSQSELAATRAELDATRSELLLLRAHTIELEAALANLLAKRSGK